MRPIMTGERQAAIDVNGLIIDPCSFCGANRWRTVVKGAHWQCRKCGADRHPAENM